MGFDRTDEQRMLVDLLAGVLAREGAGWDDAIVANGLDLLGVDVAAGGLGTDARDAAVVAAALGRAGVALPWAEHWVAARGRGEDWAGDARALLHAAEIVGLCDTMLRDAAVFAKERRQFGVAIATFQVLRHRMADMAMMLEQARAATDLAIVALDGDDDGDGGGDGGGERGRAVAAARVLADDAGRIVGEGAVQIHGAMGLTAELRLGGFFRRARALMQRDGGGRAQLRRHAA